MKSLIHSKQCEVLMLHVGSKISLQEFTHMYVSFIIDFSIKITFYRIRGGGTLFVLDILPSGIQVIGRCGKA